jgi:catechol 2,3-dioxygenase
MSLPPTTRLGPVALTVSDLGRSVDFYEVVLGLRVHRRGGGEAVLGAGGEDLVVLAEEPGAQRAGRHAGLYHVALLFADREELGRALLRLAAARAQITGASDHGVSEAIYLSDPDGNGIELYADRPRERWPPPGAAGARVGMYTEPLDLDDLAAPVRDEGAAARAGAGLRVGHVHLHVGDLPGALAFYGDLVGFDLMLDWGTAMFVAAGGYHHHLGLNVWRGHGVGPAPGATVGLRWWTLLPGSAQGTDEARRRLERGGVGVEPSEHGFVVRDPWGITLRVEDR